MHFGIPGEIVGQISAGISGGIHRVIPNGILRGTSAAMHERIRGGIPSRIL